MVTLAANALSARWKVLLIACALAAAALTAFLTHLGAAEPWIGGIAVPAMVGFTWVAVDWALAWRRRVRQERTPR